VAAPADNELHNHPRQPMNPNPSPVPNPVNRRQFLAGTGAFAASVSVLKPSLVFGADAGAKLNFGLIGCGGRGSWIVDYFRNHGGFNLVAVADYFQDKVDAVGNKFGVPAAQRYPGLSGYQRMLEQRLDAIVIESPPYFHPQQAADAVDAGKHVYLAKPIAVDVPGCKSVAESGKKATGKGLCFLVDFQTRADAAYQEAIKRVHEGQIGRLMSVEATYHCGNTFDHLNAQLKADPKNRELRLRAWGMDRVLSGDVITEQNIHALDVACWIVKADPVSAWGTGGTGARPYVRFDTECWDRFAVIFKFPNDVFVSFNSKQFGWGYDDILCRAYGTTGTLDTHYSGKVTVRGREEGFSGNSTSLYAEGVKNNVAMFHKSILVKDASNPTVAESVRSNLTTILGRTAAYRGKAVTWAQMIKENEKLKFDFSGFKS
jgi:predicted dehydrogenase